MQVRAVSTTEISITAESDIVDVRQKVRELAQENMFDSFALAALVTAASELSRNIWTHAGKGKAIISVIRNARLGLQLEFIDEGPGIADVPRVLAGGYSTVKSLGLGLSGTKRLVDEFEIDSAPGRGTKVLVRKWKKPF
ncbi:MAG: anti-sigma regulatory factor [bacterium]|nr:anti-sigma regulatory factor [bacterium]